MAQHGTDYVSMVVGRKALHITPARFRSYVADGLIGVRELPGTQPRYCWADIVALRDWYTTPARNTPALATG